VYYLIICGSMANSCLHNFNNALANVFRISTQKKRRKQLRLLYIAVQKQGCVFSLQNIII